MEKKNMVISNEIIDDINRAYDMKCIKDKNIKSLVSSLDRLFSQLENLEIAFGESDNKELSPEIEKSEDAFEKAIEEAKKVLSFIEECYKSNIMLYDYEHYEEKAAWIDKHIVCDFDYNIGFTKEGWFYLKLPFILPKRFVDNSKYTNVRFRRQLNTIFSEFFKNKRFSYYGGRVSIIYRFSYPKDMSSRRYIDFDNINSKALTDTVALYLLMDDSPKYVSLLNICEIVESKCASTELFLAPSEELFSLVEKIKDGSVTDIIMNTYPGFCENE